MVWWSSRVMSQPVRWSLYGLPAMTYDLDGSVETHLMLLLRTVIVSLGDMECKEIKFAPLH